MKSKNFPVIDAFEKATGVATSIKSLDPFTGKVSSIGSRLRKHIKDLANFERGSALGQTVERGEIKKKVLELALPEGNYTSEMVKTIKESVKFAEKNGIEMNVRIVK